MKSNVLVSLILSAFNAERYLNKSIESILNQTMPHFEFIIINDGSTDNSLEIIKHYKKDGRIKLINNKVNLGLTKSLNIGLKNSKGKYIARMDADDISMPYRLETEVNFLENNPEIALIGSYYYLIDENDKIIKEIKHPLEYEDIKWYLLFDNCFGHSTVMFRRELLNKVGYYSEKYKYAQDYEYWVRISEKYKVKNLDKFLVKIRTHPQNITSLSSNNQLDFSLEVSKQQIKKYIKVNHISNHDILILRKIAYKNYSTITEKNIALLNLFEKIFISYFKNKEKGFLKKYSHYFLDFAIFFYNIKKYDKFRNYFKIYLKYNRKIIISKIFILYLLSYFGPRFVDFIITIKKKIF